MSIALGGRWSLHDAKTRFGEVVRRAIDTGPQLITRRRGEAVVIMSAQEYERLTAPEQPLADFLRHSPLADVTLDIGRSRSAVAP